MSSINTETDTTLVAVANRFCAGLASANDLAKAFYNDQSARNVVAALCRKYRLDDELDEVHQLVCTDLVNDLKNPSAVYGLIKVMAGRKCIDIIRKRVAKPEFSLNAIVERLGESAHFVIDSNGMSTGDHTSSIGTAIDTQKAADTFNERLHKNFSRYESVANLFIPAEAEFDGANTSEHPPRTDGPTPFVPPPRVKRQPKPKPPKLTKEERQQVREVKAQIKQYQRELKAKQRAAQMQLNLQNVEEQRAADAQEIASLRDVLNFTNAEMAEALGMTEAMFCYTLYSKARPIKPELMDKVRKLRENVTAENLQMQSNIAGSDASILIEKWMWELNIEPGSKTANQEFGDFVGATRSTVWRWRNKNLTPKPGKLLEMQKLVNRTVEERYGKSRKRAAANGTKPTP